jgi:3-hydroxyacyl-[acyl-carrier-protein] dehydratase
MLIEQAEIKQLIPHRSPMLLIDGVLSMDVGSKLIAVKHISNEEPCFIGLQGDLSKEAYAYPASLVIESFGQAAAILYSLSLRAQAAKSEINSETIENEDGGGVVLLGSMAKFTFYRDIFPGDTIAHHVTLSNRLSNAAVCQGEVWVDQKIVARSEQMLVLHRPSEDLSH